MKNEPKLYPIKNEMINFKKFIGETYNSYPQKSIKFQTNTDDVQRSLINNNSTKNNHKNKFKKHIFGLKINNEIKVLKNKKLVYLNKKLLNTYSTSRAVKKFKKINFIVGKNRSSNNKKYFLGNYNSEDLAARIYDIQAIKNWGIKAKTNFVYDDNQINKINNSDCNNISDIISN